MMQSTTSLSLGGPLPMLSYGPFLWRRWAAWLAACLLTAAPWLSHAQTLIAWGSNQRGQATVPPDVTQAVVFAAGEEHNLAVRADGTVVAWGGNAWGQTNVPSGVTHVVAVAAGSAHSLALQADGTVVAWGKGEGLTDVPAAATNVLAIAAAESHNLALRRDGTVVSWGTTNWPAHALVPEAASNVVAIAAGKDTSYALRADGVPVAWRSWTGRPFGIPDSGRPPVVLAGGAGRRHALTADGALHAWGYSFASGVRASNIVAIASYEWNFDGNLLALRGDGTMAIWGVGVVTNLPSGHQNVRAIAVGKSHGLASVGDGSPAILNSIRVADWASAGGALPLGVLAVGEGPLSYEWLADGVPVPGASGPRPEIPAVLGRDAVEYRVVVSNARGVTVSQTARVAVRPLHAWGRNAVRQLELQAPWSDPITVSAGGFHSLALEGDGSVVAWGKNVDGQSTVPAAANQDVVAVAAGADHSLALKADGSLVGWGRDWDGQATPPARATNVVAIAAGSAHSMALRADGSLVVWGNNDHGQGVVSFLATDVAAIACGYYHNLALRNDGSVVGWGLDAETPPEATQVTAIAAGFAHSLVLRSDGSVLAWGDNRHGQSTVPASATNVIAIAAGFYHSLALRADGSVISWGKPVLGMTTYPQTLSDMREISAGEDHSLALRDVGRVRFGRNLDWVTTFTGGPVVLSSSVEAPRGASFAWLREGVAIPGATNRVWVLPRSRAQDAGRYQLSVISPAETVTGPFIEVRVLPVPGGYAALGAWGDDRNGQCRIPATVEDPVAIAAGGFHALALRADGAVVAWGKNRDGQTNVPASATQVIAVAAGGDHSLALRQDGSVVGWGRNWDGQATPPVEAVGVRAIAAGWAHSVALRNDGSVIVWGNNDYGQLDVPPEATNLLAIAAGYYHTLALRADRTLLAWGWEEAIPETATDIVAMAGGWGHSLAVRADGTVLAWGENGAGQCDVPEAASGATAVAAGFYHSVALKPNGTVVAWGRNFQRVIDVPWALQHVAAIAVGEDFCLALTRTGHPRIESWLGPSVAHVGGTVLLSAQVVGSYPFAFQWLQDGAVLAGATNRVLHLPVLTPAQAGHYTLRVVSDVGTTESASIPLAVVEQPRIANRPRHIVVRPHESVCLTGSTEGAEPMTLYWHRDGAPLAEGPGISGVHARVLCLDDLRLAQSGRYSLVLSNSFGLAEGLVAVVAVSPILVWGNQADGQALIPPMTNPPAALAAGGGHCLALLANGRVMAWGDNSLGQCNVPNALDSVVAIAAGEAHSVALRSDGSIWAWGDDETGQVTLPPHAAEVVAVAAGSKFSLALRQDGSAVAWGAVSDPLRLTLATSSNVMTLAANLMDLAMVKADGALYQWSIGGDPVGQPVSTASLGNRHGLAIGLDGQVLAWGANAEGQTNVPPQATNAVEVAAGGNASMALRADGILMAWGDPAYGLIVPPDDATNLVAIASGPTHALALQMFDELPIGVTPEATAAFEGESVRFSVSIREAPFHDFQWLHRGQPIPGATGPTLELASVSWEDRGAYQVVGRWPFATATSAPVRLTVRRHAFAVEGQIVSGGVVETTGPATVTIQNPFPSGRAFYSIDGSDPLVQGIAYAGPFQVTRSVWLRCWLEDAEGIEAMAGEPVTLLVGGEVTLDLGSPGGGVVTADPPGPFHARGSRVTLTAQPAPGWVFLHWAGDADGPAPQVTLEMNRSKRVEAVFGALVQTSAVGSGSIVLSPALSWYPFGAEVRANAVPVGPSSLARWEGALSGNRNPATFRVTLAGMQIHGVFGAWPTNTSQYWLVTSTEGHGVVLVAPPLASYQTGQEVTLVAIPNPGATFLGWAGGATGTSQTLTVVMNLPKAITARFTRHVSLRVASTPDDWNVGEFRFEVTGMPGDVYEIQHSSSMDLWPSAAVLTNYTGRATFAAPGPASSAGFYRVLVLP